MTITPKHVYKRLFFKTLKTQNKTIMSTHTINFRNDNVKCLCSWGLETTALSK